MLDLGLIFFVIPAKVTTVHKFYTQIQMIIRYQKLGLNIF